MRRLLPILFALSINGFGVPPLDAVTINVSLKTGTPYAAANSSAIQAALAHASSGDIVSIAAGKFPLAAVIQLKSGVSLAGAAADQSILSASFQRAQPMIAGNGVTNVGLHNFTLDGNGNAEVTQGIELQKCSALTIHDLTIQNLPGSGRPNAPLGPHAIDCTSAVTKSTFDSVTCRSIGVGRTWGGGIRLSWNSSGNLITHCVIADTGRGGIFCNDGSTDNIVNANSVSGSGGVGLGIEVQNCDRSLIERNIIDHWLSVDNSSDSAVRGNQIDATDNTYKLCGIEIVDSHDVVVTDNAVTDGAKVGLSISGPKPKMRMLFANNLFASATTWGTQIEGDAGGASHLYFYGNRFIKTHTGPSPLYTNQGHGVRLNGDCSNIVFNANEIAHNVGVGIQVTGDKVNQLAFYGNSIVDNEAGTIDGDPVPHLTWSGNHVSPAGNVTAWDKANENVAIVGGSLQINGGETPGATIAGFAEFDRGFTPVSSLWDFGDGLPATTASAQHIYSQPGVYHCTVIAWDASGRAGRATTTITINQPISPNVRH